MISFISKERGHLDSLGHGIISNELGKRKLVNLVVLYIANIYSKVLLYNSISTLGLTIGLRVICCRELSLRP